MLRVYACILTDHDIRFVLFAGAICLLSSLTAFALAGHMRDIGVARRAQWMMLTGFVTGAGIWATHFIAMLAYQPRLPTVYSVLPTLLSIVVSVAMARVGWGISLAEEKSAVREGAVVITAGIALMHFIGMGALRTQGVLIYDPILVSVSLFVAGIGVYAAFYLRSRWQQRVPFVPALILTVSICALHFGSMAAVTIMPTAGFSIPAASIGKEMLTFIVAALVLGLLGAVLATVLLDTRLARIAARMSHLTSHDPLTGIANTVGFKQALNAGLAKADAEGRSLAMLCLDLDRFKAINDVFGHLVGDAVLVEVTRRIKICCEDKLIGRLGGDEFAILVPDCDQSLSVSALAEQIITSVAEPLIVEGVAIRAGVSIGIALYPQDAGDGHGLRQKADLALYRAKSKGRGMVCRYEAAMEQAVRDRDMLHADLQRAVAEGALAIHYQPLACAQTGGILGFEALLRWNHPDFGDIPPSQFVPLAETGGLVIEIGAWVLNEACRQAQQWEQPLKIAVNLSPVQFTDRDLVAKVQSALTASGLDASRLELEITEGLLVDDTDYVLSVLCELKALGIRIAMDDFGTGFSSLSYFRLFPFDKVKIDRSFVQDMAHNRQSMAVVKAVIGLSKTLDMLVLAEGVETREQLEILTAEGCQQVQGYLIGRPGPIGQYDHATGHRSPASHSCGNQCDDCLERLRPPCGVKAPAIAPETSVHPTAKLVA